MNTCLSRGSASCRPTSHFSRARKAVHFPQRCKFSRSPCTTQPRQYQQHVVPGAVKDEREAHTASQTDPSATVGSVEGQAPVEAQHPSWVWEDTDDGAAAYAAFFLWLALGSWPALQSLQIADLPYFLGLGVLTVYIGAHRGLTSKSRQQLTVKEGALAPVAASASLFGLYLLLKYFPDLSLQTLLDVYFWLLGTAAITGAARPLLRRLAGPVGGDPQRLRLDVPEGWLMDEAGNAIEQVRCAPSDVLSAALAVGLASAELVTHHTSYTLNNMVACLVATEILALVGLRSFRTAALLLVGLLAYDVFWVFGSPTVVGENVMLQVATSDVVVGPTRLLFPRAPGGVGEAADFPYSLLGLGDIAIPGLLAGLALRFDAATTAAAAATTGTAASASAPGAAHATAAVTQAGDAHAGEPTSSSSGSSSSTSSSSETSSSVGSTNATSPTAAAAAAVPPQVLTQRPYFVNVAAAHVAGLLAAFAANSITHLGQPALLYIVPSTLLTVLGTAAARGDLSRVWHFTDVPTFGLPAAALPDEARR